MTENKDSAYYYLNYALEGDTGLYHLFSGEFYPLINDSLYNHLADRQLMKYQTKFGSFSKPHLSKKLFLATVKDQAYYYHLSVFPDRTEKYAKIKKLLNRENLEMLDEIVVEHGWPKRSEVGFEAAPAAFFIVQHAESVSTLKNYLSYIKNAVDEGEVDKYFLAFLLDKINFREGEKQVYGTQIAYDSIQQVYFLDDVVDPENLAKRRAEMNLEPIEDYIKRWKGAELRIFDEKDSIN